MINESFKNKLVHMAESGFFGNESDFDKVILDFENKDKLKEKECVNSKKVKLTKEDKNKISDEVIKIKSDFHYYNQMKIISDDMHNVSRKVDNIRNNKDVDDNIQNKYEHVADVNIGTMYKLDNPIFFKFLESLIDKKRSVVEIEFLYSFFN